MYYSSKFIVSSSRKIPFEMVQLRQCITQSKHFLNAFFEIDFNTRCEFSLLCHVKKLAKYDGSSIRFVEVIRSQCQPLDDALSRSRNRFVFFPCDLFRQTNTNTKEILSISASHGQYFFDIVTPPLRLKKSSIKHKYKLTCKIQKQRRILSTF